MHNSYRLGENMKKLFLILVVLFIATNGYCATQWYQGSGNAPLGGTTLINDIDVDSANYGFDPLNRLLHNYREGVSINYSSASALSVSAGEIVVTNSAGTIKLMLRNSSSTAVTWADIDAGSEEASKTYYVYAVGANTSATAITFKISLSATAPAGVTYYKKLGSFDNDASSNILTSTISNDNISGMTYYDSGWFSVTKGTAYTKTHSLGTTDLALFLYGSTAADGSSSFQEQFFAGSDSHGSKIQSVADTTLVVQTGSHSSIDYLDASGDYVDAVSGYLRVIAVVIK